MRSEFQSLVSVLTPVYNGESYLSECIESVLAQTYHNFEYCIVNNCSTDRTLEIAEAYAKKDKRIRIHNNSDFVGVGQNGNIAFRQIASNSMYCKVVHADDWLFPECLMKMVELAEAHPTVAIVGAYSLVGDRVSWDGLPYASSVISGREISRWTLLGKPYVFGSPTALLLRSDLVRASESFYDESNSHRDSEACLRILRSWDFGFVHQVLTYIRIREADGRTFSKRYNTYLPNNIDRLQKFGPAVLSQDELRARLIYYWAVYYDYLAVSVFMVREKEFWIFHREKMESMGHPLSLPRLAIAVCSKTIDYLFNPKRTVETLLKKIRYRA
ncbi:MAG TPA: glycosyltransferase family 2 protein [Nitrospira sp.]|nr:glycosyltransferase family 2 protein [Nitrospira sp.]